MIINCNKLSLSKSHLSRFQIKLKAKTNQSKSNFNHHVMFERPRCICSDSWLFLFPFCCPVDKIQIQKARSLRYDTRISPALFSVKKVPRCRVDDINESDKNPGWCPWSCCRPQCVIVQFESSAGSGIQYTHTDILRLFSA